MCDQGSDLDKIVISVKSLPIAGKMVLVTGGAGFLGSWMCDTLIALDARVICIDNLSSGLRNNISHLLSNNNFEFLERDICEPVPLDQKIDVVLHMASRAGPFEFEKYPIEILQSNTLGTYRALEIARENRAIFLFASTSEIYGNPAVVPTPETYYGNVNPVGPRGCYDESKRCGEAYAMAYHKQFGLNVKIVRIFNTYGPRMRANDIYGRVVPRFVDQALNNKPITVFGTGEQTRSFCYVTDQIEGLLKLAFCPEAGAVVNIGNPQEFRIIDLANLVKKLINTCSEISYSRLPKDDPYRRCPDINRARQMLGWQPRVTLQEGLNKTIEWFKSQPKQPGNSKP
jgi:UDP-glucuronate decarboxylase